MTEKSQLRLTIEKSNKVIKMATIASYGIVFATWILFDYSVYWALALVLTVMFIRVGLTLYLAK